MLGSVDYKVRMDLYLVKLSDGSNVEVRLVAGDEEHVVATYGELQAARLSRLAGRTWSLASIARIQEVDVADDQDRKVGVSVG